MEGIFFNLKQDLGGVPITRKQMVVMQVAKVEWITIPISVTISDSTAELCLKIIQLWLEADERRRISGGCRNEDGTIEPFMIKYKENDTTASG